MNKSRTALTIVVSLFIGLLLGTYYMKYLQENRLRVIHLTGNKLNDILNVVDNMYVDSVNVADMIEGVIPDILAELDPHSVYIPAEMAVASTEKLQGHFSGIGVQFTIQQDTVYVNDVIPGGPSEKVGLLPGDRIVAVDDTAVVGKEVTNETTMKKLKGPRGTEVKVTVLRRSAKELLEFVIVRDDIPLKSIDAAYMVDDKTGLIKINKFGETTYSEFILGLAMLRQAGCERLIVDLRNNTGGYMGTAIQMINEFLPKNSLIVYTKGRRSPRQEFRCDGSGHFQDLPLVVLINEFSASASEIFAGAIQANDRGTIIGLRSFGKGLVQQPVEFIDGSAIRLTTARYYTPAGRCIQKPYTTGKDEAYELDIQSRYDRGEFFSQDSIKQDESAVYYTSLGRPVYGGGGIAPDIFVPADTVGYTPYYTFALGHRLMLEFAFQYTDTHRTTLAEYDTRQALYDHLQQQDIVEQFVQFAETRGLERNAQMIATSTRLLKRTLYGSIIYNMLSLEEYTEFMNESDPTVLRAAVVLAKGESRPQAPTD